MENSKVRYVHDSSYKESFDAFQVSPNKLKQKYNVTVTIKDAPVQVCIDLGAAANTIDYATYEAISAIKAMLLKPTNCDFIPTVKVIPHQLPLTDHFLEQ